jgi:hypothetical protein
MSKNTASPAGGAVPAEGHKTRRAALAIFGSAPALAVFPAVAAEHAAKEAVGYFELKRQQEEARTEERRLCREVAVMQARTVPGLLAKLSAVADMYVHDDLEKDTESMSGKNVSLEGAALFVLRDCARMIGEQPC